MRKTYRATFFAIFYFSVLLVFAVVWFGWFSHFPPGVRPWGTLFLIALCLLGVPSLRAHVTLNDEGIQQRFFGSRFVAWADIVSWQQGGSPDSDGPETITIETRTGSFPLQANCIYGKRLAEVAAELQRRVTKTPRANTNLPASGNVR